MDSSKLYYMESLLDENKQTYTNGTTTVTYGNENVTLGSLQSGDAFDCDVNGDETYNSETERFYYVSGLNGDENSEYAVLIYYNNTTLGIADNTSSGIIDYNSSVINYQGPVTAITNLPTTTQWSNIALSNTERQITTETGTTSTPAGALPIFSYSGYSARLLTAQEINIACNIIVGTETIGELNTCNYLVENTKYSNSSMETAGYWLENPNGNDYDFV